MPAKNRNFIGYLAKYLASPPIAVRRIDNYEGQTVRYWYQDHMSKSKKLERVGVLEFIGRMVQHIRPKYFQRVRYFGLQATKTSKKWSEVIRKSADSRFTYPDLVYPIIPKKTYRERYKETSEHDPMICSKCRSEMDLRRVVYPDKDVNG